MEFTNNQKKSLGITTAVFALLFLALFLIRFTDTMLLNPEMEAGGGGGGDVAVNFGDSEYGSGDNFENMEPVKAASKSAPAPKATQAEILASDNDDAPVVADIKKSDVKPKKEEPIKPVEKPAPKPSKATTNAISDLLNGNSKGGDGDDGRAGNKGKSNGDPNARGYNGGGGSGGGTGGGTGTGDGVGDGPGYGPGSGGGRGGGNGGGWSLAGRKLVAKNAFVQNCNEYGTVVVQVTVNRNGEVIATRHTKGTTNTAPCLLEPAYATARTYKWNANPEAAEKQYGTITINFAVRD